MPPTQQHPTKKWGVSIIELQEGDFVCYKVTRRFPEMSVAETKIFDTKEAALRQVDEWLS